MEDAVGSDAATTEDGKADNKLYIITLGPVKNKERECFVI